MTIDSILLQLFLQAYYAFPSFAVRVRSALSPYAVETNLHVPAQHVKEQPSNPFVLDLSWNPTTVLQKRPSPIFKLGIEVPNGIQQDEICTTGGELCYRVIDEPAEMEYG